MNGKNLTRSILPLGPGALAVAIGSTWGWAGAVCGVVVGLVLWVGSYWLVRKRRPRRDEPKSDVGIDGTGLAWDSRTHPVDSTTDG